MKIKGHEIRFMRTVLADCEIAKVCRENKMQNFGEVLEGDTVTSYKGQITFVRALQAGWEQHERYENPDYEPFFLSEEDLQMIHPDDLGVLLTEAFEQYNTDGAQEVETEEPKGSKKKEGNGETR